LATSSFHPYRAFISYSHRDKAWCDWLHRGLERYRIGADLAGRITDAGPVPRHLRPVFRDRADFSAGGLQAQTIEALKNSQFLIVIASPDSAASAYVNEEIRLFKSLGGEGRVLSLIVSGEPPGCFAAALRLRVDSDGKVSDEPADPVAADALKDGRREALVKIVAGLTGLPYDILWQRDVKAERLRIARYAGIAVLALVAVLGLATMFWLHRDVVAIGHNSDVGMQKLERLVIDAAGGGAASVKALADIRDLLRPGNPEIDAIAAEQLPKLVQRIIEDLQKPAARPEDFAGAVKRVLQEAQAQAANLHFQDAANTLDTALAQAETDDQNRARGHAALLAERGRVSRLQLRYREAAGFYAKAAAAAAFDTSLAWGYAIDSADSLYAQGDEFGDNTALGEAIATYESALSLAPRERVPLDWATTQDRLGSALRALGERESGTATLQKAVAAYGEALKEWTRERVPLDWAATQNNLGTALETLGNRESGTETLQKAVAAYGEALKESTRERVPLDWAATQNNLGNALEVLGKRERGTETLQQAVAAYGDALREYTRERVPLDWAMTQNNLGNALEDLGQRESGTETLQKAVAAYGEALKERKRDRVPLRWATTQNNLGNALEALGERESGTATLQKAVAAFGEALKERTRERVPLQWATTQNNLGNALRALGDRESATAISAMRLRRSASARAGRRRCKRRWRPMARR
jgi:tetratricopeptide (TPR) repeat protein